MPAVNLSEMVTRMGRAIPVAGPSASDSDLLGRFIANRDAEAFAELVRRHGPSVFGVCRRVTGHHHLAEDAFQAVFLVLATKASSIHPRTAIAGWLYGVAHRTALRARTMNDRRRKYERSSVRDEATIATDPTGAEDLIAALDAEVARLPEHLRAAVVLCELQGRGRTDAAGDLGIPEGTLSSRLAAARKALAARLRSRGIVLSAAGLLAGFAQLGSASVPSSLASRAEAALDPALVPAPVADLFNGVLRIMFAQKLKAVPIAVGLSSMAVLAWAFFAPAAVPTHDTPRRSVETVALAKPQPAAVPAAPKALPKGPNKLLFYRAGHLTLIDPDGKNEKAVSQDRGKFHPGDAKLSPDGKQLAILIQEVSKPGEPPVRRLHVRALEEKEPGTDLGVSCQLFAWSPDGTEIVCSDFVDRSPEEGPPEVTSFIVNMKTKEKTTLKLPENHIVTDWSRDGKQFLTSAVQLGKNGPASRLHLMNRDGTEHKALTDEKTIAIFGRLSADGRRVLFSTMILPKEKDQAPKRELAVLDIGTGKTTTVEELPLNGEVQAYCWSPDGKQIAYSWRELHEGKPGDVQNKETESFLVVCDPDGKNAKTIATEKGMGQGAITIGHIDWR